MLILLSSHSKPVNAQTISDATEGLGPLGPTTGNLCNQAFVVNYFKAADNV